MNDEMELSNEYLTTLMTSEDHGDCRTAISEIMKRGEAMFEFLLNLKGNSTFFPGDLGDPNAAELTFMPHPDFPLSESSKNKVVTVEVAGLYLISAIYFQRTDFSRIAVFRDLNIEQVSKSISNKKENVERAYQWVEKWVEKCRREGIASLREKKIDPLAGSNLYWW